MEILAWTILFCLGWRIITDENQILYFIRKYFEDNHVEYDYKIERIKMDGEYRKELLQFEILWHQVIQFIGKPLVICITCMSSIWGVVIFLLLTTNFTWTGMILNCVCASFIQTFIWKLYNKLD